ncbi:hypothetical protein CWS72_00840 [Telmatospirillum siberiense]|uniref:Uncharacterized protein n=2 Tax=Telmatospirillum siberiense TaxID=382514 RepID=A0A2N3Q198_9PROT|nr:hypothetical protein CWS72_00840 [Telmatospirillum siberiense]
MTALAGAGVTLGTASRAFAFSEDTPNIRTLALHDNACGASASHKELVSEVERVLGDKYSEEEKRRVIAAMTCPICGCPLSGLF